MYVLYCTDCILQCRRSISNLVCNSYKRRVFFSLSRAECTCTEAPLRHKDNSQLSTWPDVVKEARSKERQILYFSIWNNFSDFRIKGTLANSDLKICDFANSRSPHAAARLSELQSGIAIEFAIYWSRLKAEYLFQACFDILTPFTTYLKFGVFERFEKCDFLNCNPSLKIGGFFLARITRKSPKIILFNLSSAKISSNLFWVDPLKKQPLTWIFLVNPSKTR